MLLLHMHAATRPSQGRSRTLIVVAISAVVALIYGALAYASVKPAAVASTHVFVDTAPPSVAHRPVFPIAALIDRAELLGRIVTSPPLVQQIAHRAGVPAAQLAAEARTTASVPSAFKEPGSEERASEILISDLPYRLEVEARQTTPVLDIYTRAPSAAEAVRLANAAVASLQRRLTTLGDDQRVAASDRVVLRQLGPARGGVVNSGMRAAIGLITFVVVFVLAFAAMRYATRKRVRTSARELPADADDAWPHTTRLMPWMFALFLAMVWLVPFDQILLTIPSPIDLTLDRLLLPFVVGVWALALLMGGSVAPRLRWTRIHTAVGLFVVCAFVSVFVNAGALSQALELDAALKRLPLLISYVSVFVIASTAVRGREVRPFLTYTLVLALTCTLGVLWEYRFKQNLFNEWSEKLLPGIFEVGKVDPAHVDELGRRMVKGPATVPLETVAMLAMALPIPLVRFTQAERGRDRVLYGLAACLLFAGVFATFRKSGLLAPLSVIATIAYFRRRELLKLAPLGLVLVVLVPVLAPGAVATTIAQFDRSRLGATTVSDRTADYDAIRPDVWTHLLFGRGWGSYNHVTYRILDSEILQRLIEMGVLGLVAYLFMIGSVIWAARSLIAGRDRTWAPLALIGAAGAVSFGVVSTLFDTMSFPHGVYIFLCTAGLVAVVVSQRTAEDAVHDDERHTLWRLASAPASRRRGGHEPKRAGLSAPSPG
jgi:O-antigen ligase